MIIPLDLKNALNEQKLVIFIGAGVSMSLGLPSWAGIVEKVLTCGAIEKGEGYLQALKDEILTPLEVLDKLKKKNRLDIYKVFEAETSSSIRSDIYRKIQTISNRLITTNYDELIEDNLSINPINIDSVYNLKKIDDSSSFLLKIHGSRSAMDKTVIFTEDYDNLYNSPQQLAKFQFEKIITSYSCLFLGFSLNDNYVCDLFDKLADLYDGLGRKHFVVSTTQINHDFVETIKISSHSELETFLEKLIDTRAKNPDIQKTETAPSLTSSTQPDLPEEGIEISTGSDAPPKVENWAGRSYELTSMSHAHRAVFITGIGGQGKSALASKYLNEVNKSDYEYIDWRDFKEEDLNFQTKLYQLIEIVSKKTITTPTLVGLDTSTLIEKFFNILGDKKGVFVFDNVDKYIHLLELKPSGDMGLFFEKTLNSNHNSKFIFTCRPFIQYAGVGFYQIRLEGLKLEDTIQLVSNYHQKIKSEEQYKIGLRLHTCTKGHPLWMGLVLASCRLDASQIYNILDRIERKSSDAGHTDSGIISNLLLQEMWNGAKDRERIILRTLAISGISESAEDLSKIVSKKLNYNQFSKALRSLQNLNLIITKEREGFVELHPLVREFIKTKYGREEQDNYISLYVQYLDGFILLIKSKLGKVMDPEDIDPIIKKLEILSQAGRIQDSVSELRRVRESLFLSGYSEDYLRLSEKTLEKATWTKNKISSVRGFMEFIHNFFSKCSELEREDLFQKYQDKFNEIFNTPDQHMILARSALCNHHWIMGRWEEAIIAGETASLLVNKLDEKDLWEAQHRYHLALRDSKKPDNINKAMCFFLEGKSLQDLNEADIEDDEFEAVLYGNVGKCLELLGQKDEALLLFYKSYASFNDGNYSGKHNLGYAALWISEVLLSKSELKAALCFKLNAKAAWDEDFPVAANRINLDALSLLNSIEQESLVSMEAWQIKLFCDEWINSKLRENSTHLTAPV